MTKRNKEQREQLKQTQAKLEEHRLSIPPAHRSNRPRPEKERRNLVEQRIQEAMVEGAFDNLPGKGKPLNLKKNPYADPGQDLAFSLLRNNGFAPEWIERDKEIRRELAEARNRLRAAWQKRRGNPAGDTAWQTAVDRFEASLHKLNQKIADFNLIVPAARGQRPRLRLARELRRIQEEIE